MDREHQWARSEILTLSLSFMLSFNIIKRERKLLVTRGGKGVHPARVNSAERGTTSTVVVDKKQTRGRQVNTVIEDKRQTRRR